MRCVCPPETHAALTTGRWVSTKKMTPITWAATPGRRPITESRGEGAGVGETGGAGGGGTPALSREGGGGVQDERKLSPASWREPAARAAEDTM